MLSSVKLNDGRLIPQLGFGTFRVSPEDTEERVLQALETGYRHIDTAAIYRNEDGVGRAIAESGIAREELWITTKLWNDRRGPDQTRVAIEESLTKMGLDYVDLYLIHWPAPANGPIASTWETFGQLRDEGLARSIGVSNFDERFLPSILETGLIPAVDQIELHPQFQQRPTIELAEKYQIAIEAWGPLGQGKVNYASTVIGDIAREHQASWAQVILAWHLTHGHIVFPKSSSPARMSENLAAAQLQLTTSDIQKIDELDQGTNGRVSADPTEVN